MVLNISTLLLSYGVTTLKVSLTPYLICNQKALKRHDSYKIIILYVLFHVNEIQHYSSVFYEVFVVVFVGFVLVFILNCIFLLTFVIVTAILDIQNDLQPQSLLTDADFLNLRRDHHVSF